MEFLSIKREQREYDLEPISYDSENIIEFRNVSFKYPGSDRLILDNVCFCVRKEKSLELFPCRTKISALADERSAKSAAAAKMIAAVETLYLGE